MLKLKVAQKVTQAVFYKKNNVFKLNKKVTLHLGYFCKKIVTKNFQKLSNLVTLLVVVEYVTLPILSRLLSTLNHAFFHFKYLSAFQTNFSWGATIAQWICLHLPVCRLGFKSQAHHLWFYQFILICVMWKMMKINTKGAGIDPFKK